MSEVSRTGALGAARVARLLEAALGYVQTRGELAVAELEEERSVLEMRLAFGFAAFVALQLALGLGTLLAVVAAGPANRVPALGVAALAWALLAAGAAWWVLRLGATKPRFLSATFDELARDRRALRSGLRDLPAEVEP